MRLTEIALPNVLHALDACFVQFTHTHTHTHARTHAPFVPPRWVKTDPHEIHCAFLPMNLPYTMTPEMVADAAKAMKPKILYPYHFGETDTSVLAELLKGTEIEVRIRRMQCEQRDGAPARIRNILV